MRRILFVALAAACAPAGTWQPETTTRLSGNWRQTAFIDDEGDLWRWGDSYGDGYADTRWAIDAPEWLASGPFETLQVGPTHSCAVTSEGALFCWGRNCVRQVDFESADRGVFAEPTRVFPKIVWRDVAVGGGATCATDDRGRLHCWGAGGHDGGQGDCSDTPTGQWPTVVPGAWRALTGHWWQMHGVDDQGQVFEFAWDQESDPSVLLPPERHPHDWSVFMTGIARDVGLTPEGKLAEHDHVDDTLTQFEGGPWSTRLAASYHSCALDLEGAAWCWGRNRHGQLGVGHSNYDEPEPVAIPGHRWSEVTAGQTHSCGLDIDGAVWCWGSAGALGLSEDQDEVVGPTRVEF